MPIRIAFFQPFGLTLLLISLHVGCSTKTKDTPLFPETTNLACRVIQVPLDSALELRSFLLAPNKQHILVWTNRKPEYQKIWDIMGRPSQEPTILPSELYLLDTTGQMVAKITIPASSVLLNRRLWCNTDGKFNLQFPKSIRSYDWDSLQMVREWIIREPEDHYSPFTWSLKDVERENRYLRTMQRAVEKSRAAYVQFMPSGDYPYLMLDFKDQAAESWYLPFREDVEACIRRYGRHPVLRNPFTNYDHLLTSDSIRDKETVLRFMEGQRPSESEEPVTVELSQGKKTKTRFRIPGYSNFQIDDNQYLTTADGAIWLIYQGHLYRIKMNGE